MTTASGPTRFSTDTCFPVAELKQLPLTATPSEQLDAVYEVAQCADIITAGSYERIALQFPDSLLVDAAAVARALRSRVGRDIFILGDTSYGSCCVDEVAAEHLDADLLIHYGRSCLSPTRHIPVVYVFASLPLDVEACAEAVAAELPKSANAIIFYDVRYSVWAGALQHTLGQRLGGTVLASQLVMPMSAHLTAAAKQQINVVQQQDVIGQQQNMAGGEGGSRETCLVASDGNVAHETTGSAVWQRCGRRVAIPDNMQLSDFVCVYVGEEDMTLNSLVMNCCQCKWVVYNAPKGIVSQRTADQSLRKRYYLMEKSKDATVVGILVGTLSAAGGLEVLAHLKKIITAAGKKAYTFVMGKVNEYKVANFPEVDVFVLMACSESVLLDSKDYCTKVVTPYEMELACVRGKQWTGDYSTDFGVFPQSDPTKPNSEGNDDDELPDFSPITGELRQNLNQERHTRAPGGAVATRDNFREVVPVANAAAHHLLERQFRGLEVQAGQTEVALAVEGRRGIARGYSHEEHSLPESESMASHISKT